MARRGKRYNKGQWAVQRERLHLTQKQPGPEGFDVAQTMGDFVPGFMKKLGLDKAFQEERLIKEWKEIAGATVAKHTRPGRLDRKVLYVYVSNSAWLAELSRFGQKQLLEKVQTCVGEDKVKSVKLLIDPEGGVESGQ